MNTHTPIHPNARGHLATTSLPELLVVALERRLEGSFLFDVPHEEPSALVVRAGRVIKVRAAVPPWRVTASLRGFTVIEFPSGTLARSNTIAGDSLICEPAETVDHPSPASR